MPTSRLPTRSEHYITAYHDKINGDQKIASPHEVGFDRPRAKT